MTKPTYSTLENQLSKACRWMADFVRIDGISRDLKEIFHNEAASEEDAAQRIAARIAEELNRIECPKCKQPARVRQMNVGPTEEDLMDETVPVTHCCSWPVEHRATAFVAAEFRQACTGPQYPTVSRLDWLSALIQTVRDRDAAPEITNNWIDDPAAVESMMTECEALLHDLRAALDEPEPVEQTDAEAFEETAGRR